MQLTLRRASAIQTAIATFLAGSTVPTSVAITKYEDLTTSLNKAEGLYREHLDTRDNLLEIQYLLRKNIGIGNSTAINALLAERAYIVKRLELFQGLISKVDSRQPAKEILVGKMAAMNDTSPIVTGYGGRVEAMAVGLLDERELKGLATRVGTLKRLKVVIDDQILAANLATTVELEDHYMEFLKTLNLI